jgi:hypothetical protein
MSYCTGYHLFAFYESSRVEVYESTIASNATKTLDNPLKRGIVVSLKALKRHDL